MPYLTRLCAFLLLAFLATGCSSTAEAEPQDSEPRQNRLQTPVDQDGREAHLESRRDLLWIPEGNKILFRVDVESHSEKINAHELASIRRTIGSKSELQLRRNAIGFGSDTSGPMNLMFSISVIYFLAPDMNHRIFIVNGSCFRNIFYDHRLDILAHKAAASRMSYDESQRLLDAFSHNSFHTVKVWDAGSSSYGIAPSAEVLGDLLSEAVEDIVDEFSADFLKAQDERDEFLRRVDQALE